MSATTAADLCRTSIYGPSGRVDLAVPAVTTVGALIALVVPYVAKDEEASIDPAKLRSWVLQRLGEAPFDPDGTPETLDWRDGERFYLRPADDAMPELDFDDIADGMATAVSRRPDRWTEAVNRQTFLGLASVSFGTAAVLLAGEYMPLWSAVTALVLTVAMLTATTLVGRLRGDRALAAIIGLAGCGYAGLTGVFAAHLSGPVVFGAPPTVVLVGAASVTAAALTLLALQRMLAPKLPIVPFGIAGGVAVGTIIAIWLRLVVGLTMEQDATLIGIGCLALLIAAPHLATRAARLRGPQLPRNSAELRIDIEPYAAEQVVERVGIADGYLTVVAAASAVLVAAACRYLLLEPTWVTQSVVGLLGGLLLLRSREFRSVPQRLFLVLGGVVGGILLALSLAAPLTPPWRLLALLTLLFVGFMLALAALRPETRRLLPIWGHLANILETLSSLALVPLLIYLLGLFAWARGLGG